MDADVVDLFCGIGGLSYGFRKEGFRVVAGVDSDASCAYAFETNVGGRFVCADIREMTDKELVSLFPRSKGRLKILIGCAPCQPFSMYTDRYRKGGRRRDVQWRLLEDFARAIRVTSPDVVSMENVARVTRHAVFKQFVKDLEDRGYAITHQLVRAQHYGVPQRRTRLVLLASRYEEIDLIQPTCKDAPRTVRDAIGHLPSIKAGESHPKDRLHKTRRLSQLNQKRLRATKQGGSWKDWDSGLQLACHRREEGRSFRSVYGRMRWDMPAPVITTQCLGIGNGRFGHPTQDRAISIREAALLQSFPAGFKFVAPRAPVVGVKLARQIGNAVPPLLGRAIAKSIRVHLQHGSIGRPSK